MWLLNTKTARLKFFSGPNDKRLRDDGGYAILSHVWQEEEQTFQDIMALSSHTPTSDNDTPRSRASPKIRECCKLAAAHGYRWVWIDTCCINKESSAELSEAINSMFEWYRKAVVCYVYLFDVPINNLESNCPFYESKWFRRGWTLQELIAPHEVLFLLSNWTVLGTKTSLVGHLNRITSIDEDILLHRRVLGKVSISIRMSWASRRQTTRAEDEAYCLMGIFGVNMPTIYGEGGAAFYRLQEEIMKIYTDQTLFAWDNSFWKARSTLKDLFGSWSNTPARPTVGTTYKPYLLAPSPSYFNLNSKFEPIHIADAMKAAEDACMKLAPLGLLQFETITPSPWDTAVAKQRISKFTVTSHGMQSTLPVIEFRKIVANQGGRGDEEHRPVDHVSIAVLGCKDNETGDALGLLLHPLSVELLPQLQHQGDNGTFGIGLTLSYHDYSHRLVKLGVIADNNSRSTFEEPALDIANPPQVPRHGYMTWATIYIIHRPPPYTIQDISTSPWETVRPGDRVLFRFSRWSLAELERDGFQADQDSLHDLLPPEAIRSPYIIRYCDDKCSVTFASSAVPDEAFTVVLDKCICSMVDLRPNSTSLSPPLWRLDFGITQYQKNIWLRADVSFTANRLRPIEPWADSPSDRHDATTSTVTALDNCGFGHLHIARSPKWTKRFGDSNRAVELTFTLDQATKVINRLTVGGGVYICLVDIKLAGRVYMSLRDQSRLPHF